ncbi:hypothetical protein F2Q68_00035409 [Brassica cretica]|uniref:Uncharacterized protein n=1 Tax=Brassica cretica TaxID=69181 RepID=A0A8S9H4M3_BRACR|nr:hypothetical protein F2Q68_00035409 [Brassica cretica]
MPPLNSSPPPPPPPRRSSSPPPSILAHTSPPLRSPLSSLSVFSLMSEARDLIRQMSEASQIESARWRRESDDGGEDSRWWRGWRRTADGGEFESWTVAEAL